MPTDQIYDRETSATLTRLLAGDSWRDSPDVGAIEADSSDDGDSDIPTQTLADDLVLVLVE